MAYDYVNFSCIPQFTYGTPGKYATLSDCENAVSDGTAKPVLILNPLWSASKKASLPLLTNKLGDGYQQIIFQGLNQINEEWSITSPVLLGSQADELLNQLRTFCVSSFLWSPNNGIIPYQEFTCEQWSKTRLGVNAYQIRGVFKMTVLGSGLLISGDGGGVVEPPIIDIFANNAVLRLTGNGANGANNFRDNYGGAIARNGSPAYSNAQSRWNGSSIFLNGSSTIELSAINFSTEDLTFECWVYITQFSFGDNIQAILGNAQGGTSGNAGLLLCINNIGSGQNRFTFRHWVNGNQNAVHPTNVQLNTWYHVAGVKAGTTLDIYVNGVKGTSGSTFITTTNNPFTIGGARNPSNFANNFIGYIDDILITRNGAKYTANFTLPTQEFTVPSDPYQSNNVLLLDFDNNYGNTFFYDYCGNTVTGNGNPVLSNVQRRFGNTSLSLNGTTDFISINNVNNNFNFGIDDFTIEGWFYFSGNLTNSCLVKTGTNNTSTGWAVANSKLEWWIDGNSNSILLGNTTLQTNIWYHLAVSKASGVYRFFVNGVLDGTSSNNSNSISFATLNIGRSTFNGFLNGYVDSLRVTKGIARYTANFTPDSYPAPIERDQHIDKVVCLNHFNGTNNSTTFTELTNKTITRTGNAVISTTQSRFNGSGLFLDGNSSLVVSHSNDLDLGVTDFTIECWIRLSSVSGEQGIIGKFAVIGGVNSSVGFTLRLSTGNSPSGLRLVLGQNGVASNIAQLAWTPSVNTWYHIAVTRSSGVLRVFVDGVQLGANISDNTNIDSPTAPLVLGLTQTVSSSNFSGFIDEVRITKGLARYSANFTVPTRPFPDTN